MRGFFNRDTGTRSVSKAFLSYVTIFVGIVIFLMALFYYQLIISPTHDLKTPARAVAQQVLLSYYRSSVTAEYWENSITQERVSIDNLSRKNRIELLSFFAINLEFKDSKFVTFAEFISPDCSELRTSLGKVDKTTLNNDQLKNLGKWLSALKEPCI